MIKIEADRVHALMEKATVWRTNSYERMSNFSANLPQIKDFFLQICYNETCYNETMNFKERDGGGITASLREANEEFIDFRCRRIRAHDPGDSVSSGI